ncbi:MAG: hypothetical protein NSGCLCUN01_00768 [uncultured Clostridium sp.]
MDRQTEEIIKNMDKRSNIDKAKIEIVDVLSKHQIRIDEMDLVFDLVKKIVHRETKIHISPEVFNKKY